MVSDPDLTARAQIRDCALSLFADRGPDAVTIRDIAECAHVSPALVLHHYGSKQGLREAVDQHVAGMFDQIFDQGPEAFAAADAQGMATFAEILLAHLPPDTRIPAYLRRLILSGDPAGKELFRTWLDTTVQLCGRLVEAGVMRPSEDPEAQAAFLMVNDLAMILFRLHIIDALDFDPLTPEGLRRWVATAMDAYANGVFRLEKP